MKPGLWFTIAGAVVFVAALWALVGGRHDPRAAPRQPGSPDATPQAPARKPGEDSARLESAEALRLALEGGDAHAVQDAAASLRRTLRLDAAARRRAEEMLLARETPRELRAALALILGTLGGSDPALLQALRLYREEAGLVRCILFALGAARDPPDDDDVFGLGDRPWGVHGPKGLGITVRRPVEDPVARAAIAAHLADSRGPVREAAAVSLRHSTSITQVRSEFLATLRMESSDDVALVLGEALAVWVGGSGPGVEQVQIVNTLLARAGEADLDGFRFRMEDDFRRIRLNDAQAATLAEYARPAHSYAVRSFALSTLTPAAPAAARPLLERLLGNDRDAAIRDLSARLLGTLPRDDGSIAVLVEASRRDEAWNVRYQAVDALGRFVADPKAAEAIRAATKDADGRVAKRARQLSR